MPIVASADDKPNYLRFLPRGSYINVYDFESIDQLVEKLSALAADQREYEKYLWFRYRHNYSREYLSGLELSELVAKAKEIIGADEPFFGQLVAKEASENKLCKVARFLKARTPGQVRSAIEARRGEKASGLTHCLPGRALSKFFKIP